MPAFQRNVYCARLALIAVDGFKGAIEAHYNPKEIQIEKTVPWTANPGLNVNVPGLGFTRGEARTLTMELFLDGYEDRRSLADDLDTLTQMSLAIDPESRREDERRPPLLKLRNVPWPDFTCVVESLSIKVTMFDNQLRPVRALVNLKLKEALKSDFLEQERNRVAARSKGRAAPGSARGA